uniref:DENN domain containing 3 n=1 Tax=Kryptolebias marmoratus TaxID=37003 RepID=A0A3Q3F1Q8_KRYMA
ESVQLEPGILHVLAPPFVSKTAEHEALRSCGRKRNSCLKKKREQPSSGAATTNQGGLEVTSEEKNEQFHFLVFTDVSGNKTYGVVMQYYRPILLYCFFYLFWGKKDHYVNLVVVTISPCVICSTSCLLTQLRTCRLSDMEEKVKEFATKLTLVPVPPPGQLHLVCMFTLHPLTITLPSREDKDQPLIDLDLHLPFLCFRPQQLLQVLSCLLQEQRVVLFSADWARLCLIYFYDFSAFLQPLSWQHPFVPVLPRDMLDFLMAPTAFLMGSHLSHFSEVAAETDDLILVNIDDGSVSSSSLDVIDVPDIPPAAADCFTHRCQSLQAHFDLDQCHSATHTDIDELREQRRAWQHKLNHDIQRIALELVVNIFRDVSIHLNYEHRVFHSEEFLNTRHPNEQLFYKKVLDTQIFHSFLRDRLNKKMDNFARMELSTRSDMQKYGTMPHRPNMQEIQAKRKSSISENRMNKRLGMSLPNLAGDRALSFKRNPLFSGIIVSDSALKSPPKPVKVLKLPLFPVTLSFSSVQSFFIELIQQLGKAIDSIQNENSSLLARFYYLRGLINTLCLRRLDALSDFQNLCKTDTAIFPTHVVTWLVDSLQQDERQQVHKRPELKRLIFKKPLVQTNNCIKRFKLPQNHLDQDEFVRCVQECGIVKDVATILRLFDALAGVEPEVFRLFYTFWKETEAGVQDVNHLSEVVTQLDNSECVYKLSSCVKTSHGVGKIAMTQKRLFLLTEGKPGFLEITKFRDIKDVKIASTPFLLGRVPSLRVLSSSRSEVFEANLRTETKLWSLVVREMWAGRKMADEHKDPEYITRALTNVLLMDAVVGCLQTQRSISAASKLAHFDKIKHEAPMMVPETTSETLKHKINPSLDLAEPQTVHVLLYTPGQLSCNNAQDEMNPKLWVALSGGRVVVFDAASWLMLQDDIQVGESQVTCMMGLVQDQVWMGSQDSVIYIIDTHSMSCNKQLTEHRHEVTGLSHIYSCSCDGTVLQWDLTSLTVKQQFNPTCDRLSSIQIDGSTLWCCECTLLIFNFIMYLMLAAKRQSNDVFVCLFCLLQRGQLWAGCSDSVELYVWQTTNLKHPFKIISLPNSSRITCMIGVKNQVRVLLNGDGGQCDGQLRSQVFVVDLDSLTVAKELLAHSDSIQTLCSAEDRYVLSGAARHDGKIAIWKVE